MANAQRSRVLLFHLLRLLILEQALLRPQSRIIPIFSMIQTHEDSYLPKLSLSETDSTVGASLNTRILIS